MSGRIEHDAEPITITIRGLPARLGPPVGHHDRGGRVDVGHQDLEVQLFLRIAVAFRPK